MSLKIDRVELEIVIKNDESRKRMRELENDMRAARKELKKHKEGTDEYVAATAKLRNAQAEYDKLFEKIGLGSLSIKELQKRQSELNAIIKHLPGNSPLLDQYRKQLTDVTNRISQLNGRATQTGFSLSKMANGINKYFGMITVAIAGITGASLAFRKMAEDYAHMDDVYSDVAKTTNLTKEEIQELNEEFKKMDTRTSRESLNQLARDAGKLGTEGKENIMDFVEAGNQINVALDEDLGEDAIKNIGKMVGVFDKSTKELQGIGLKEQMLAVGSAINAIGASSSADEGFLVSFAGRLGGVAKQANISMDAILGFGSALDQDMQQVEMSATALQNFIMKLMGDPAKFAKLAGLEVKSFTKLLNTDANAAIKQVLRAMNEKGGFQALIPLFQDMGLDGARAVGVLSSMAGSIDKIDEAQILANKSMAEGTSITKEYDLKNTNLAAKLDKAKKGFTETALELGSSLNPILLKSTHLITYLTKGLVLVIPHLPTIGKWLLIITGYMIAYNGQQLLNNILLKEGLGLKIKDLALKAKDVLVTESLIYKTAIQAALVGKTTIATKAAAAAQAIWNVAMQANPLGLVIGALTTITALIWIFSKRAKEVSVLQQSQINIQKKVSEGYDGLSASIATNVSILNNEKIAIDLRKKALNELKETIPGYHASLTNEGVLIDNNTEAIKEYLVQLERQTKFTAVKDELTALYKRKRELEKTSASLDNMKNEPNSGYLFTEKFEKWRTRQKANTTKDLLELNGTVKTLERELSTTTIKVDIKPREGSIKTGEDGKTYIFKGGKWILKKELIITSGDGDEDPHKKEVTGLDEKLLAKQVALKKEGKSKEDFDKAMLDLEVEFLTKKRDLYKKDSAQYNDYENRLQDIQMAKTISANEAVLKVIQDSHSATLRAIDVFEQTKKEKLQDDLDEGLVSQEDYTRQTLALDKTLAEKRLQEGKDYAALISDTKFNSEDEKQKAVASATNAINAQAAVLLKADKAISKNRLQEEKEHLDKVTKLREELGLNKEKLSYKGGLNALKKKLKDAEASEKESADAITAYKLEKAQEYAQESVRFVNTVADFVGASNDAQAANLEASKQRELTAAGKNADERQAIEEKYAQKELDLKKKQADANMIIAISQATAQGALGVAEIWAKTGVNPIYAGILTALLVGITGAQIATAVEQRNAIKSTSLGYRDGGYTISDPSDDKEDGPVHANEFVTRADGVRNPAVRKFLDVFDLAQKNGTIRMLNTTQILEKVKLTGGAKKQGGYGSSVQMSTQGDSVSPSFTDAFFDLVDRYSNLNDKLLKRLDEPLEAYSLISGPKGSFEQTNRFKQLMGNVSRSA